MKKINRREYLKSMGATAGVIAGAKLDVFAQRDQSDSALKSSSRNHTQDTPRIFVESGNPNQFDLQAPQVKLVFYGLAAIWRNSDGHGLVGFHSKASTKHQHRLMIKAWRREGTAPCTQIGTTEMVPPGANLDLEIFRPDIFNGVFYFQPALTNGQMHDNDFRWMMNLEGDKWYNQTLTRKPVHAPILKVTNGLFHTIMKTKSTFRRQKPDGSNVLYLGNIASYVGTNIYLQTGGHVNLSWPAHLIECPQAPNVRYEIHFINHCNRAGTPVECSFRPYSTDKTERSDFYMHFDGIDLPADSELELIIAQGATGDSAPICGSPISDESPCSAVGYGGTAGFPSYP